MRSFALEKPETVAAGIECLRQAAAARPIAGGTALVPLWKQGVVSPTVLVDLAGIQELRRRHVEDGTVEIGAMTRLAELEDWSELQEAVPLLHTACRQTANRRIREMATLGGSLAHGESASDVNAAALACDVTVHLVGPAGARTVVIADFFLGLYETAVGPAELVTHVSCRTGPAARRHAYVKFSPRSRYDRPALGVAVACGSTAHGACEDVRIALSNVTERPVRAVEAEQVLEGQRASRATIDAVAATAARAFEPMGDLRGSSEYKRAMIRVFVRRALEQALAAPGT